MQRMVLMSVVAFALTITVAADVAEAFGGRGYARRQARRARRASANVVYRAPVRYDSSPVVNHSSTVYPSTNYPSPTYPSTNYPSTVYSVPASSSSRVIYHDHSYVPSTFGTVHSVQSSATFGTSR